MFLDDIFGWVGTLLQIPIFISPLAPFIKVFNKKINYEKIPTTLIVTSYFNCLIWYMYSTLINSQQIEICSIIGCCISLSFIIIYFVYEIRKYIIDTIVNALIILSLSWIIYRVFVRVDNYPEIAGKICLCSSIIALIYPIFLIYKVLKYKNYLIIPVVTAIFSILGGIFWVLYGLVKKNYYIAISNSFEIIVGIVQVIIRSNIKKKYKSIEVEGGIIGIMDKENDDVKEQENEDEDKIKINYENTEKSDENI